MSADKNILRNVVTYGGSVSGVHIIGSSENYIEKCEFYTNKNAPVYGIGILVEGASAINKNTILKIDSFTKFYNYISRSEASAMSLGFAEVDLILSKYYDGNEYNDCKLEATIGEVTANYINMAIGLGEESDRGDADMIPSLPDGYRSTNLETSFEISGKGYMYKSTNDDSSSLFKKQYNFSLNYYLDNNYQRQENTIPNINVDLENVFSVEGNKTEKEYANFNDSNKEFQIFLDSHDSASFNLDSIIIQKYGVSYNDIISAEYKSGEESYKPAEKSFLISKEKTYYDLKISFIDTLSYDFNGNKITIENNIEFNFTIIVHDVAEKMANIIWDSAYSEYVEEGSTDKKIIISEKISYGVQINESFWDYNYRMAIPTHQYIMVEYKNQTLSFEKNQIPKQENNRFYVVTKDEDNIEHKLFIEVIIPDGTSKKYFGGEYYKTHKNNNVACLFNGGDILNNKNGSSLSKMSIKYTFDNQSLGSIIVDYKQGSGCISANDTFLRSDFK